MGDQVTHTMVQALEHKKRQVEASPGEEEEHVSNSACAYAEHIDFEKYNPTFARSEDGVMSYGYEAIILLHYYHLREFITLLDAWR